MRTLLVIILIVSACANCYSQTADPPDLVRLTAQWQKAREQATEPIDKKYLDALMAMKVAMTKQGNLEGALAVDVHIKALAPRESTVSASSPQDAKELPRTKSALEKFLIGTTWTVIAAKDKQFIADMEFVDGNKMNFQKERLWSATDKRSITVQGSVVTFNESMTAFTVFWANAREEIGTFKSRKPSK